MSLHILIADDDEHIGYLVKFKLEKAGHQVTWETNGTQALAAIQAGRPDVVILDVMMPGMGGFQVLDAIKSDMSLKHIPVIMLTAMGQENDVVKGITTGADDYLVKPFRPSELQARIERLALKKPSPL
ncbi:MAG: response regulator [Deltaproteobacteria bacterium]|nr:response regulator [Deltaproteobacteria bacterium]